MNNIRKPQKVILWGAGDFAREYMKYLQDVAIDVSACTDTYHYGSSFCGHDVLSPEQLKTFAQNNPKVPIIPTGGQPNNYIRFIDICAGITNRWKIKNKILHPCFLADHLDLDYSGKVFVIGFGGSGNMLLREILMNLLPGVIPRTEMTTEEIFERLAFSNLADVRSILNNFLYIDGMGISSIGLWSLAGNDLFYAATGIDGNVDIKGIKTKLYLQNMTVQRSHEPLSEFLLHKLYKHHYKIFVPIRNPLDILYARAYKINQDFYYRLMAEDPGLAQDLRKSDTPVREQWGQARLQSKEWFEMKALEMKQYLESYLNICDQVFTVKYEDVIEKPIDTINNICTHLSLERSEKDNLELWKKIGFKSLAKSGAQPGHLFHPGSNVWKIGFTWQNLQILRDLGFESILSELGYVIDWNVPNNLANKNHVDNRLRPYIDLHVQESLPIKVGPLPGGVSVSGNSIRLIESFMKLASSNFFQQIAGSAAYE